MLRVSPSPQTLLPAQPSVAILGSGALGTYYGAKLARLGLPVSFLARRDLDHLQRHGLQIRCTEGDFDLKSVRAFAGRERILCGVCHVCVSRPEPGVALNMSGGNIRFSDLSGGDTPRARSLAGWFEKAGIRCSVAPSVGSARWYKLVWNVPFNGLAIAGGGIDTARILADPKLHQETLDLMQEVMTASDVLGFTQDADHPEKEIIRTRKMGAYQPSSLLDYLADKPVELESIWGEALRHGTAAGVPMPHLQKLYEKLKTMVKV